MVKTSSLTQSVQRPDWPFACGLLTIACVGLALIARNTHYGIGTSPDSIMYLGIAKGMLAHHAIELFSRDGWHSPVVTYMPGVAAVYAGVALFGVSVLTAAKVVNLILLASLVVLVGLVVRISSGSRLAASCAALLIALTASSQWIYSFALSEALFMPLVIGGLAAAVTGIHSRRRSLLVLAGMILGAAYLTRYAGAAFIAAVVIGVIAMGDRKWRERSIDAAVLGGTAGIAVLFWIVRNHQLHFVTFGRSAAWHGWPKSLFTIASKSLRQWIVPDVLHGKTLMIVLGVAGLLSIAAAGVVRKKYRNMLSGQVGDERGIFPLFCLLAATAYLALLVVTMIWFDPMVRLDLRIVYPLLVLLIVGSAASVRRRTGMTCLAFVTAFLLAVHLPADLISAHNGRHQGLGYSTPGYLHSPTLKAVSALPLNRPLYSNAWDAILLHTDRHAPLINRSDVASGPVAAGTPLQSLRVALARRHAIIILLNQPGRTNVPNVRELTSALPVRRFKQFKDGAFYVWDDRRDRHARATTQPAPATTQRAEH